MQRPDGRIRAVFGAILLLATVTAALPPDPAGTGHVAVAGAALVATAMAAWWAARQPEAGWWDVVAPLLALVLIAVLRDSTGGTLSGLTALVALPWLWTALFGTLRQHLIVVMAMLLVFAAPVALIGAPDYPSGDWKRAAAWLLIMAAAGPVVHQTVRRLADREREVSAAERRWQTLLDHLPDVTVLVFDEQLRYREVRGSGAARQGALGFVGRGLHETSSRETARALEPIYRAALAGKEGRADVIATHTGRPQEVVATPLPPGPDGPEAMVVARDVGDQHHRQDELEASRRRFERLFDESPHGIAVIGVDGCVESANVALAAMIGVSITDIEGQDVATVPGLGGGPHDAAVILPLPLDAGRLERRRTLVRPDGQVLQVFTYSVPLRDETGTPEAVLVHVVDVSDQHRYEQQLAHIAAHDPLTGLSNRRRFDEEVEEHLNRCRRYGPEGALLLLDLDNFKQINDTLGHHLGDQLIISVAQLLRRRTRSTDLVARLGGDEFAILLPHADRAATATIAQGIVEMVASEASVHDGTRPRRITASVGAVMIEDTLLSASELLSTADLTMYDAKDAGRNTYVLLDTTAFATPRSKAQLTWAERITRALEDGGLEIHAQPILELKSGMVSGAELLLRMRGSDGELILPGRFLYVAERLGLVAGLDMWVMEQAIDVLARIQTRVPDFRLEVNLSGRSVGDPRVEKALSRLIKESVVDPGGLVLEITETAAISDIETARLFAQRMAAIGCRFALDDFGAGFGSFYYLKHLLFDYVKIDGEFVAHCPSNPTDRLILASVVGIARGLGKQTVAEFVEDEQILDVVRAHGVDHAQGYHVGRPIPVEQFLAGIGVGSDQAVP